jgi:hypothetical protein
MYCLSAASRVFAPTRKSARSSEVRCWVDVLYLVHVFSLFSCLRCQWPMASGVVWLPPWASGHNVASGLSGNVAPALGSNAAWVIG